MSAAKILLSAEIEGLREMRTALGRILTKAEKADVLGAAIEKAIDPVLHELYWTTPLGPTGNLRLARDAKVVKYPATGVAVGIVGFRRAGRKPSRSAAGGAVRTGPDRGFHQYWLEEGTQRRYVSSPAMTPFTRKSHTRQTKYGPTTVKSHLVVSQGGYIASSYYSLGPFKIQRVPGSKSVQTDPAYERAFFKKSKNPISINPMPPGGFSRKPPLATAWSRMQPRVAEYLTRELRISLEAALSAMSYSPLGSINQ